ncbi:MAG: HD domain-containing protein, partial [Candidatus Brocadiales bacterium]|nr:HD domain-containing protein [Candidatus Bathyanammoxibius sp.]
MNETRKLKRSNSIKSKQKLAMFEHCLQGAIMALASMAEMRDPYTAGHQQRVAELVVPMAKEMGLPEEQVEGIRISALLHDIGKVQVPADILSKPSRLSETEF